MKLCRSGVRRSTHLSLVLENRTDPSDGIQSAARTRKKRLLVSRG